MRIGISCYNMSAQDFLELAVAADQVGFDALWLGEHLFRSVSYESEHPRVGTDDGHLTAKPVVAEDTHLLDPWTMFAAASAVTTHIGFATGIYLLPLRHPLTSARVIATVDELSEGRVRVGVGAGWLEEEFAALGIPFKGRMRRFEEAIEVLRLALSGEEVDFHGSVFSFDRLQLTERPVVAPIIMGGNGPQALERAARLGDGWFASGTPTLEEAAQLQAAIRGLRTDQDVPFPCYFRIADSEADTVAKYQNAGIENVIVWADKVWVGNTIAERTTHLARVAKDLGLIPVVSP